MESTNVDIRARESFRKRSFEWWIGDWDCQRKVKETQLLNLNVAASIGRRFSNVVFELKRMGCISPEPFAIDIMQRRRKLGQINCFPRCLKRKPII